MKIKTHVKASGILMKNHGLVVKSAVRAGGFRLGNHRHGLVVKSAVRAGGFRLGNHRQLVRR